MIGRAVVVMLAGVSVCALSARAQPVAQVESQINRVQSGTVRLALTARAGVCGNGWSWFRRRGGSTSATVINGTFSSGRDVEPTCDGGEAECRACCELRHEPPCESARGHVPRAELSAAIAAVTAPSARCAVSTAATTQPLARSRLEQSIQIDDRRIAVERRSAALLGG